MKDGPCRLIEEIEVLESEQHAQIAHQAESKVEPFVLLALLHSPGCVVVDDRR